MSGRGRKQAGNGGSSTWSSNSQQQEGHQVRQGSSFWECPGCGTAVHTALMAFHISSCPVVGGDEVAVSMNMKAKAGGDEVADSMNMKAKALSGQERGQSPLERTKFLPVSVSYGKADFAPKAAWREEEIKADKPEVEEEDEEFQGQASSPYMEAGAGVRVSKSWSLDPETPIQDGRDRMAVSSVVMASPPALDSAGRREVAEARRKRLFEDWGQMLSPEPKLIVELSPGGDDAASAAAPSFPVYDPEAKRSKVNEPFFAREGMMVVDLGLIDSGSDDDDVGDEEPFPYLGSIPDSLQERTEAEKEESVAEQISDHTQKIPAEFGEVQEELRGHDDRSPETGAEIRKRRRVGDGVRQRELYLESAFSDLRKKYFRALLVETDLQRALNVKNEECEELRRREQGLQRELLSARGQLESTLQELRDVVDKGEQKTDVAGLENDMPTLSEATQIYKEDESVATQLQLDTSHSGLDDYNTPVVSQSTQICKEDTAASVATQLLPETSNSLTSCSASPNAGNDEIEITKVLSENLSDMEERATQLLSSDLDALRESVPNSPAGSAEFRRASVSDATYPPAAAHGLSSISWRSTIDRGLVRRLFVEGTQKSEEGCPKDECSKQLPHSVGAAVAVLPPQTPSTALKSADEHHDRRVQLEGNGNANLGPLGSPGGGPMGAAVAVLPPQTPGTALKSPDEHHDRRVQLEGNGNANLGPLGSPGGRPMGAAVGVLPPQTPGTALKSPDEHHDRRVQLEGNENANLGPLGSPGGGPTTPETFAVLLGRGQEKGEKGLISEMLNSFPPAQGTETQGGIDPFNHQFLESVHQNESDSPIVLKDHLTPMQDVQTPKSVSGLDQKFDLDNERPALPNKPSEDIDEDIAIVEMWPETLKRPPKNVIVVSDSDDDEDPASPQVSEKDRGDEILAEMGLNKKRRMNSASVSGSIDDGRPVAAAAAAAGDPVPLPSEDDSDEETKTLAEIWRNKKRSRNPAPVSASQTSETTSAVPIKPSEDSKEEETLAEMGPKKKRRKNPVLVLDSDDDLEVVADDDIVRDTRASTFSAGDSGKGRTEDSSMSRTKLGELDSGMHSHISHPTIRNCVDLARETSSIRNKSPSITVLFGMDRGEENVAGISGGGGGGRRERGRSGFVKFPDPVTEPLSRDRKVFSPLSVNVILSSSDEEGGVCEGSRGSSSARKTERRRRLVRLQESRDEADSLRPDPLLEAREETGAKASVRRSERIREVYASGPKRTTGLSEREEGRDSIEDTRGEDELGTGGDGSRSKPLVLDDDNGEEEEDGIEMDSDSSSDGRPVRRLPKHGNEKATQARRNVAVQRNLFGDRLDVAGDDEDEIDTDDSFINDDPESDASDAEPCTPDPPLDDISESGEESESSDGSLGGKTPSAGRRKANWELEGDMLATLAKDTDLCLRGICALFRRQEEDEKIDSDSKYTNKRGFSKFHASRASHYASFLMGGGDLSGPVVKTAEEFLEKFGEDAVTYCSDMCIHYSKQLFDIYENNEDQYFPEPYVDPLK